MAISWTKSWSSSDDGSIFGGSDLENIQSDIDTYCGTIALDNLASVAINTSLVSDTDSIDSLGSSSKYWANAYIDEVYTPAIQFPATQVPSADPNTLDDYEEGTFTTTLTASTSGTITVRSAFNTGQYIKIGKMCFVSGYIEIDSVSSPIGTLIMNLPFTVDDTSDNSSRTIGTVLAVNLTEVKDNVAFICYESEAQTRLWLTDGVTGGYELAGYIQANTNIHFSLSFRTSS